MWFTVLRYALKIVWGPMLGIPSQKSVFERMAVRARLVVLWGPTRATRAAQSMYLGRRTMVSGL